MAAAIVGALIGSVGVVLGVLIGQSLQEYGRTKARAIALARDVATIGSALLGRFAPDGTLIPSGWGPDYYRFGSTLLSLADCCEQLLRSPWSWRRRKQYREAIKSLDRLDARWAAVHVKLDGGVPLTTSEIDAVILTFGGVARVLRPAATADPTGYVGTLRKRVDYFIKNGIDADPKGIDL
jgi:hypothetical protein